MNPLKPVGGLVAVGVAASVLGAAYVLAATEVGAPGVATVAFVALVIAGLAAAGSRSREWLAGEYW